MEQQAARSTTCCSPTLTSGTTRHHEATQKDYLLSLELIDVRTGIPDKELSAPIRKAYSGAAACGNGPLFRFRLQPAVEF